MIISPLFLKRLFLPSQVSHVLRRLLDAQGMLMLFLFKNSQVFDRSGYTPE
jgi:hypothetical protein